MQTLPLANDVIAITGTPFPEPVVTSIIQNAALIGGDCLQSVVGPLYTAAVKWLAAHMVASAGETSGSLTSDKLGDAAQAYARAVTGAGLMGTVYGQQAIALVPCLSGIGMRQAKSWVL
jgi:hypothetical protein